ncbi:MAG: outer membrane beta-barrel protein [Chitinophagaceae bacterium]
MKTKIFLLTTIIYLLYLPGFTQSTKPYSVKAQVVDSVLNSPIEFATVSIKNKVIEKKILTNKTGDFIFEKLSGGKYEVVLEVIGYQLKTINVDLVDSLHYDTDLGKIILVQKLKRLGEVTVITKKPLITQEIDRIIYNLQEDPDSKVFSMLDMMRKVPFISVTADDQIQFKGNTNFKVLLDGKNSSILSSRNLKDVLKGIPASNILQIEVITVPPAKYESEGLAGIINIVTNRKLKDGYSGSVNANYSNLFSGISGSVNFKKRKFGLSGFGGSSWERVPLSPFNLLLSQVSPVIFELRQIGDKQYNSNQIYGTSLLSFEFDSLNLLAASLSLNTSASHQKNNQFTQLFDNAGSLDQSYSLYTSKKNTNGGGDAGLNYQRGFKRNKTQLLTLSYKYLNTGSEFENSNTASSKLNYILDDYKQKNKSGFTEHSTQLDYVHLVKKLTIEAGSKLIYRHTFSDFMHENFNTSTGQFEPVSAKSDIFEYNQNIFSFYNSYLLKVKNWAVRGAFRLEATTINANFRTTNSILNQKYTNLVPSVSFLYRFKNTSTATMGYTQRIQRPGITLLNPFVDQSDPKFYRVGNSNLLPVLTHNLILNYGRFKKSSINLGITYSFSRNAIQSLASSAIDSIIRITYQNIGEYDNVGTNINLTFPISKAISLTGNGTINYVWIKGKGALDKNSRNQGIEGFAYSYLSYRTTNNWRFSINAGFYGPVRNLQGNSNAYFYSSIGASKQIFKQKGSLSLTVSNPFQKFRTLRTLINTSTFYQETINKNSSHNISMGFYYRFGKLNEDVKKNKRNINNDDKVSEIGKTL